VDLQFKHQIRVAIDRRKENQFQRFVDELFIKKYSRSFIPVKQKHDKGCDGILNNNEILAAYAPANHTLKKFKKKIGEDHDSYVKNWKITHPKWCVVYNGEFTAEMIKFIDSLESDAGKIDIGQIVSMVERMNWANIRDLAEYLGIPDEYYINDIMQNVISDLLKNSKKSAKAITQEKPIYIEDKIELNYDSNDIENAKNEYSVFLPTLGKLKGVLKTYDDEEINALKVRVISEFGKLGGKFKVRLENLADNFAGKCKNDQQYLFYVKVILLYMFEICLIGKKVEAENGNSAA
jgi:hypothetical protein